MFGILSKFLCSALFVVGICGNTSAENVFQNDKKLEIVSLDRLPSMIEVTLPSIAADAGKRTILSFDVYLKCKSPGGWSHTLTLDFNGARLGKYMTDGRARLLRRNEFQISKLPKPSNHLDYWRDDEKLMVRYSSEAEKIDPRITSDQIQKNTYTLDISDVPWDSENSGKLVFTNHFSKRIVQQMTDKTQIINMFIENLRVDLVDETEVEKMRLAPASPIGVQAGGEMAFTGNSRYQIPTEENPAMLTISFPPVPKKEGMCPVLVFDAYLTTPNPGGWNHFLQLELNHRKLKKYLPSGSARLLRRGNVQLTKLAPPSDKIDWWRDDDKLLVRFTNSANALDARIIAPCEEKNRFFLNIADAVNYRIIGVDNRDETGESNKLVLTNSFVKRLLGQLPPGSRDIKLAIENLHVELIPEATMEKLRPQQAPPVSFSPSEIQAELNTPTANLSVTAGGDCFFTINGEKFFAESSFSYPKKPQMGFHSLTTGRPAGIKPEIKKSGNTIIVMLESEHLMLRRVITAANECFIIADTLSNLTKTDAGHVIHYRLFTPHTIVPSDCYLAGVPGRESESAIGYNPTVFVVGTNASLGVMARDDVFRTHLQLERSGVNQVTMSDHNFGLPAGKSYTIERIFLPQKSTAYFDFVNALRHCLSANQTMIGPDIGFGPHSSLRKEGVKRLGFWHNYFTGHSLSDAEYAEKALVAAADIRRHDPDVKVVPMIETNLVTIDRRSLPGGESILPKSGKTGEGEYVTLLSKEATELIQKNTIYADSLLYSKDGRAYADTFYSFDPYINLIVRTEVGNARYNELMKTIAWMLDELKFDGVYFDQFNQASSPLLRGDRASFDKWDGHSVILDRAGNITDKFTDTALTGIAARKKIIEEILSRGKIVRVNAQSNSCSTSSLPVGRFQEMEIDSVHDDIVGTGKPKIYRWQAFGHLSASPAIMGIHFRWYTTNREEYAKVLNRAVITALRNGTLYFYYNFSIDEKTGGYGLLNHMYPITPMELGEGFIIGKERILTAVSRSFITAQKPMKLLCFDDRGREKEIPFAVSKTTKGWKTDVKLHDWNETCTIVLK